MCQRIKDISQRRVKGAFGKRLTKYQEKKTDWDIISKICNLSEGFMGFLCWTVAEWLYVKEAVEVIEK